MYNEDLETYFNQYIALSENRKSKLGNKYIEAEHAIVNIKHRTVDLSINL